MVRTNTPDKITKNVSAHEARGQRFADYERNEVRVDGQQWQIIQRTMLSAVASGTVAFISNYPPSRATRCAVAMATTAVANVSRARMTHLV